MNVIKVLFVVIIVGLFGISTVQAAKPINQACLGESVSDIINQYGGSQFGEGVSIIAKDPSTFELYGYYFKNLGEGVQALLKGEIPSPVYIYIPPNPIPLEIQHTCYNPPPP